MCSLVESDIPAILEKELVRTPPFDGLAALRCRNRSFMLRFFGLGHALGLLGEEITFDREGPHWSEEGKGKQGGSRLGWSGLVWGSSRLSLISRRKSRGLRVLVGGWMMDANASGALRGQFAHLHRCRHAFGA